MAENGEHNDVEGKDKPTQNLDRKVLLASQNLHKKYCYSTDSKPSQKVLLPTHNLHKMYCLITDGLHTRIQNDAL